jgi:hypothetical protein
MKTKIAFATATAIGLALAGQAYAAANTLHIDQIGTGNQADVHQVGTNALVGSDNDIGTSANPAVQNGTGNYLLYSNSGYGAGIDNDIIGLLQIGTTNWAEVHDQNTAAHTRINTIYQNGTSNGLMVWRAGDAYSLIDQVLMAGTNNKIWISQGSIWHNPPGVSGPAGDHNTVSLASVNGNNNAYASTPGNPYAASIRIQQTGSATVGGSYNKVTEASITGSNNASWLYSPIDIYQEGSYNGQVSSVARLYGSVGNFIAIREIGNGNNFSVLQGINSSSTGNNATVTQTGNYNSAAATQFGDDNRLTVLQNGDSNDAVANFTGSRNGNGLMTGIAFALLSENTNLAVGTIYQNSTGASGNHVTYNVNGSDNLFAMAQIGGNNTIVGTVQSNGNQAAVLQTGNNNLTNFIQTGGNNNAISVNQ